MSDGVRLGAVKFWGDNRGCPRFIGSIGFLIAPPLGARLVALRQSFVRRCHGGLGSPGLPGIDKSSMMAGEVRAAWDVGRGPMPLIPAAVIPELAGSLGGTETQFYIHVSLASDE
jgi:hypothetical protein